MVTSDTPRGASKRPLNGPPSADKETKREKTVGSSPQKGTENSLQRPGEVKIFVGNLSFDLSKEALTAEFSSCGNITHTRLVTGVDGRSRGVAFLTFSDKASADRAVTKYHERMFRGRKLQVNISTEKEDRKYMPAANMTGAKNRMGPGSLGPAAGRGLLGSSPGPVFDGVGGSGFGGRGVGTFGPGGPGRGGPGIGVGMSMGRGPPGSMAGGGPPRGVMGRGPAPIGGRGPMGPGGSRGLGGPGRGPGPAGPGRGVPGRGGPIGPVGPMSGPNGGGGPMGRGGGPMGPMNNGIGPGGPIAGPRGPVGPGGPMGPTGRGMGPGGRGAAPMGPREEGMGPVGGMLGPGPMGPMGPIPRGPMGSGRGSLRPPGPNMDGFPDMPLDGPGRPERIGMGGRGPGGPPDRGPGGPNGRGGIPGRGPGGRGPGGRGPGPEMMDMMTSEMRMPGGAGPGMAGRGPGPNGPAGPGMVGPGRGIGPGGRGGPMGPGGRGSLSRAAGPAGRGGRGGPLLPHGPIGPGGGGGAGPMGMDVMEGPEGVDRGGSMGARGLGRMGPGVGWDDFGPGGEQMPEGPDHASGNGGMRSQGRNMQGPMMGAGGRGPERGMPSNIDIDGRPGMDHGNGNGGMGNAGPGRAGNPYDGPGGPRPGPGGGGGNGMPDTRMGPGPRGMNMNANMSASGGGGGDMPRRDGAFGGGYPERGASPWTGDGGAGYDSAAVGDRGAPSGERRGPPGPPEYSGGGAHDNADDPHGGRYGASGMADERLDYRYEDQEARPHGQHSDEHGPGRPAMRNGRGDDGSGFDASHQQGREYAVGGDQSGAYTNSNVGTGGGNYPGGNGHGIGRESGYVDDYDGNRSDGRRVVQRGYYGSRDGAGVGDGERYDERTGGGYVAAGGDRNAGGYDRGNADATNISGYGYGDSGAGPYDDRGGGGNVEQVNAGGNDGYSGGGGYIRAGENREIDGGAAGAAVYGDRGDPGVYGNDGTYQRDADAARRGGYEQGPSGDGYDRVDGGNGYDQNYSNGMGARDNQQQQIYGSNNHDMSGGAYGGASVNVGNNYVPQPSPNTGVPAKDNDNDSVGGEAAPGGGMDYASGRPYNTYGAPDGGIQAGVGRVHDPYGSGQSGVAGVYSQYSSPQARTPQGKLYGSGQKGSDTGPARGYENVKGGRQDGSVGGGADDGGYRQQNSSGKVNTYSTGDRSDYPNAGQYQGGLDAGQSSAYGGDPGSGGSYGNPGGSTYDAPDNAAGGVGIGGGGGNSGYSTGIQGGDGPGTVVSSGNRDYGGGSGNQYGQGSNNESVGYWGQAESGGYGAPGGSSSTEVVGGGQYGSSSGRGASGQGGYSW